jgi:hypothetical protein
MKSVIVEEGSAPDGDGHVSYAAHLRVRRRNLACRPTGTGPPITAHTKACRHTAPDQPADHGGPPRANAEPTRRTLHRDRNRTLTGVPGRVRTHYVTLDSPRES